MSLTKRFDWSQLMVDDAFMMNGSVLYQVCGTKMMGHGPLSTVVYGGNSRARLGTVVAKGALNSVTTLALGVVNEVKPTDVLLSKNHGYNTGNGTIDYSPGDYSYNRGRLGLIPMNDGSQKTDLQSQLDRFNLKRGHTPLAVVNINPPVEG